ncbi:MAG TPA: DNA polymerase III subunit gamma/tau [Nitrococcus sp.]|nr:DNA polymerase III subunit gamma/tau [Nitrococcus sp.]
MSYQVLARKWRPRTFAQMAGQEHVLRALCNGFASGRIHHAYLFAGTRGVGKTTIARILAKCLNCESRGVTAEPCGECAACQAIDQGRFVDLIEVDAASRTRVEDTRELLDNVQYAPAHGRFKIYLIDEVHMLSQHSFNALLKTLEEPPPHVKFLLATTDPQKLPATILSRCLQFNLKRLPADRIVGYLGEILAREGIQAEPAALRRLGHAADGSMRDALSLLDQAIAYGGAEAVREQDVREMLGSIENDFLFELLEALADRDGGAVLRVVARMTERSPDFGAAVADLLVVLHRLALAQSVADALPEDLPERDRLLDLSRRLVPEDVQLFYQIGLTGRRDLPLAPDPRTGFEMVLLRMLAFRPVAPLPLAPVTPSAEPRSSARSNPHLAAAIPSDSDIVPGHDGSLRNAVHTASKPRKPVSAGPLQSVGDWYAAVKLLPRAGMVRALAGHCLWLGRDGDLVRLRIDSSHAHLLNSSLEARLCEALSEQLGGEGLRLRIEVGQVEEGTFAERELGELQQRQKAAEAAIENDPNIAAFREAFDAQVIPDSIQPSED